MNKDLARELLERMKADQEMRFKMTMDQRVDLRNCAWLKKIVQKYGWPDSKMVGKRAAVAAWILAQHADHDPAFQAECLKLLTVSYKNGHIVPEYFALLTDRVRMNQGKPQVYGTQFHRRKNGKLGPWPIRDKKGLAARRITMGLGTFESYQASMLAVNEKIARRLHKKQLSSA